MPLSPNEIRARAIAFSREWKGESSEDAEAKSFWDGFFNIFGITRRRIASFEKPVKKSDGKGGYIDLLWKGMLLVEHKSRGLDLDRAYSQATEYFAGLKERDLPRYVVVSDFARFRLYDLEADSSENNPVEFGLADLHKHISRFGFISGYQARTYGPQREVDVEAAEELGLLHDLLRMAGYNGHALEVFLVRVLFCLFADGNGIFEAQQFREWVERRTHEDGSDLGSQLHHLFEVLDEELRAGGLDEQLAAFRYINGRLFTERVRTAPTNRHMRERLLECARINWSKVSPAIFGALFQSIMDKKARRNLGAHYTSETNILKALEPLFLDDLRAEFQRVRRDSKRLEEFHGKLANIRILDPACGCGNFLVVAYRELRLLELEVLREIFKNTAEGQLNVSNIVFVDVDQFYGIEIEEFPAQIAQVALWMTDHQMNQLVSTEFGQYFARLPLKKAPSIVNDNALRIDWARVAPLSSLSYIVGNPPFAGKSEQNKQQKADHQLIFKGVRNSGVLDYVACWYQKATQVMSANPHIEAALVSTNSVTQGEQVATLWPQLNKQGVVINFAHRPFVWTSEAKGRAAVHCVIIGFAMKERAAKKIFLYPDPRSGPLGVEASHINAYLLDHADVYLPTRTNPITDAPIMKYGSKPVDGSGEKRAKGVKKIGNLVLTDDEKKSLLHSEPAVETWLRPFLGSEELINGNPRWCLWLTAANPKKISDSPLILKRLEKVRAFRNKSTKAPTRAAAATPSLFGEIRQPNSRYLAVPEVSSEKREYIPCAFLDPYVIASNLLYTIEGATLLDFGILMSRMHMAWVRTVCGRLKSDYRYSAGIAYNNFPWPDRTDKQKSAIESAGQSVLQERAFHADSSLAVLYNPLSMPSGLVKAHHALDCAVDAAYGTTTFASEAERVAFLFTLYEKLTSLFLTEKKPKRQKRASAVAT